MIDTLLSLISPHRCSSCGEIGSILCESCKYDIVSDPFLDCVLCTQPCGTRGICQPCRQSSGIVQAWCAGERHAGLKNLLDKYKFESSRAASSVSSDLLDRIVPKLPRDVCVVSIPSAPATIRARGFDHMGRIAKEFAKKRQLTYVQPLERVASDVLHFLPRLERIKLGARLFRLSHLEVPQKILLLDDIVTTGTTLRAAIKLLKHAGAKQVYVAVIARQLEEPLR